MIQKLIQTVFNSQPAHIAVLDANGIIVAVNDAWKQFARDNGCKDKSCYVGSNYLESFRCTAISGSDPAAQTAFDSIGKLLRGECENISFEYPCHSATEDRWFLVRANKFTYNSADYFVINHENISDRVSSDMALRETQRVLTQVLETLPVGIWILDREGLILHGNPAALQIWCGARYVGPEEYGAYRGWWLNSGEPISPEEWASARAIRNGETSINEEIRIQCFDDTFKTILNSAMPLFDDEQQICGAIIVNQDITERKQSEQALRANEEKWRTLFDILPVGVSIIGEDLSVLEINPALEDILKLTRESAFRGEHWKRTYLHSDGTEYKRNEFASARAIADKKIIQDVEVCVVRDDGVKIWTNVCASPLPLIDSGTGAVVVTTDVTSRKHSEDELEEAYVALEKANMELREALEREQVLARTDGLTGVYNRRRFFDLANEEVNTARKTLLPLSLMVIDLDHFKRLNDTFGHQVGDDLLNLAAQVAQRNLRSTDILARYGGEEFVVMLPNTRLEQAHKVAERIREDIAAQGMDVGQDHLKMTISIGVADLQLGRHRDKNPECATLDVLIRRADNALYAAKKAGRNRTQLHS